ncbi:MAG: peptidoglycan DD-metalloendopeptidase family protein [Crocinitomicaceae bacterium]
MIRSLLLFIIALTCIHANAQKIIDTLESPNGPMVIYADRSWQYLEDLNFDGVMNERLYEELVLDTTVGFLQSWNHDMCYTSDLQNDPAKLKDTIWVCVEDSTSDRFEIPFDGVITSSFGWRKGRNHNGTDIDLSTGDTVRAAWSGKIRYAQYNNGGFGNLVIIRHENGLETFYAHLSKHLVVPNQEVKAGEPIGLGGNTGHSYGSHLHFEVRFYDIPLDPEKVIDFKNKEVRDENLLVHKGTFGRGYSVRGSNYSSGTTASSASSSSSGKKYYRVRSGDTLSGIARKHRTTVSRLCQLNGIRPTTILQIGRNLRVN